MNQSKVVVIGGGAAGFFAAVTAKRFNLDADVVILEKTTKVLAKVKVSGGGRCNVTNNCFDTAELAKNYPRGEHFLKKAFKQFAARETIEWFENRNVALVAEADNRIFPKSNESQTIIDCLMKEAFDLGVKIQLQTEVCQIQKRENDFEIHTSKGIQYANSVIVTVGGIPKKDNMQWLIDLGCKMVDPTPSLFTFNMPKNPVTELMGLSVENVFCRIEKEKLNTQGSLLVTHWGMSGPAVLRLSAWGSRLLAEKKYNFNLLINWVSGKNEEEIRQQLIAFAQGEESNKKISSINPFQLPKRMWLFICQKAELPEDVRWSEIGKKNSNKLINQLVNDLYSVSGKTTFKEEFVTAGGVDLSEIDVNTMQHKCISGLFFAGEVLDVDGITGGFNFQAAWTTGFIAGKNCLAKK